jgi:CheY-like chemotaxis protein
MKVKMKSILIAGYATITIILILSFMYAIIKMNNIDKEVSGSIAVEAVKSELIESTQASLSKLELASEIISSQKNITDTERNERILINAKQDIDINISKLEKLFTKKNVIEIFDEFKANWNRYKAIDYSMFAPYSVDEQHQFEEINNLRNTLNELQFLKRKQMMESIAGTKANTSSTKRTLILLMFLTLAISISVSMFITRLLQNKIGGEPDFVNQAAARVIEGDLKIDFGDKPTGIFAALQKVVKNLELVVKQANVIVEGNYESVFQPRSENDMMGYALKQMSDNLRKNAVHNTEQNWLKDGLNELTLAISGDLSLQQRAEKAISFIGGYVKIGRGVLYVPASEGDSLILMSTYAYTNRDKLSNEFKLGEGVVGQVALGKKPILLKNMGKNAAEIVSGTAAQLPYNTYTYPLLYEDEIYGVVEIATTQAITSVEQDFLNQSSGILASYVLSSRLKEQVQLFLAQAQEARDLAEEKAKTLQEMNAQMEEQQQQLQQTNAQMEEQQQQLQQQTEELQQSNAQMEEQQQQLQQQQEELQQTNETLVTAKVDLDKRAQDLELSNLYKSEFLANMSHELRTPLNSIMMLSKLIARNEKGNMQEEDIKKANIINSSGEELLRLINDILDLSKLEAGKNAVRIEEVSPATWENELHNYFNQLAQDKELEFVITNHINKPIITDADKVSQILRNFLSNAIKFTTEGFVRADFSITDHPARPVKLEISDSGIGISPDQQKKIFDAFHQVDSSVSREFGGTGLGLTIAKRLTNILGGEITLKSEEGTGSVFTLWLPLEITEGIKVRRKNDNTINPVLEIKREIFQPSKSIIADKQKTSLIKDDKTALDKDKQVFLIIEDDVVFASIVGNVIHSMGKQFVHASTGEAGLQMATKYMPSGIILDITLPDVNGVELLRKIKGSKTLKNIPVQIISSLDKDQGMLDLGAMSVIQKPVKEEDIKTALTELLDFNADREKHLLIVEDNETQRSVLVEFIGDEDIEVIGVGSEAEALTELRKGIYDAIIIDLGLEGGNGFNLCKTIRQKKNKLPIIVYTGKDLSEAEEKEIKQFADRIIIKTINSVQRLVDELAIFLHLEQKDEPSMESKPPLTDMIIGNLKGKKILIVDDDIKNVYVLCAALENKGMIIKDTQNGKVAIEMMRNEEFDLILMDIMMPVMDGFTAMRMIRGDESLKHTPIIALTAKALREDRDKCIDAGANDYISKPVDYDGLLNLIQAWIHKKV